MCCVWENKRSFFLSFFQLPGKLGKILIATIVWPSSLLSMSFIPYPDIGDLKP